MLTKQGDWLHWLSMHRFLSVLSIFCTSHYKEIKCLGDESPNTCQEERVSMHGTVFVVTQENPTEETLSEAMMPFHTYEADGIEDYTVIEDITSEVEEVFKESNNQYTDICEFAKEEYGCSIGRKEGNVFFYTRTNPNAKWDYYTRGMLNCSSPTFLKKEFKPTDILYDGKWHSCRNYEEFMNIWKNIPEDAYVSILDYHC